MRITTVFLLLYQGPLAAMANEEMPNLRPGEQILNYEQALSITSGNTLIYADSGESRFSVGGAYSYTYSNGGGTAFGMFEVQRDGRVCIEFKNGFDRCDLYVRNKSLYYMIDQDGNRFPFQMHLELKP